MNKIIHKPAQATVIEAPGKPVPKLALIGTLLDAFGKCGINYCHWKSNEHLAASMTADTDLDILFDEKQKDLLVILLNGLGFKKFTAVRQKQYKDIEDFIGLDFLSGKIIHVHAHFRLTMGEAYLKSYQLNIEEQILSRRIYDNTFGIYRIDPAFEMILLYFREALKLRNRDVARMYFKKRIQYTGAIVKEYKWLKQRCTEPEIAARLKSIVDDYRPYHALVTGDFNRVQLLKLSVLLKKEFNGQRLFSPLTALLVRWYREVSLTVTRKLSRHLSTPVVLQRIHPGGGLVVAVIGADGSGKSTVIENLQSTFRKKLDVYRIYFGKGRAGGVPWPRKWLVRFKKMAAPAPAPGQNIRKATDSGNTGIKKGFKATFFRCIEALMVAIEKRRNLQRMQAAKNKGMLVICDRFPQNQVLDYNDGPVLQYLSASANPLFRMMSKMEARLYAYAVKHPPHIVIKLVADAGVINARKPSRASMEMLETKIEGIKKLKFPEGCRVITVDAAQPLESVLFTIKKEIWDAYR